MINQRGQAFSVFELMIAAIVAIAILFVLLPIIQGITTPTGDARTTIGNALSVLKYGKEDTGTFRITGGDTIRSSELQDKADSCSFYFDAGKFNPNRLTTAPGEEDFDSDLCNSRIINQSASNPINAKAVVVCAANVEDLEESITNAKLNSEIKTMPNEVWGSGDDYAGFDKICVVLLRQTS
jgi:hypothetical protein